MSGGLNGEGAVEIGFVFYQGVFEMDDGTGEDVGDETDDGASGERLESVMDGEAGNRGEVGSETGSDAKDDGGSAEVKGEFINPEEIEF